jgi:hypothetical protein
MKKLVFIFVILFTLLVNTGCKSKENTIRFNPKIDGVTTETADTDEKADTESKDEKKPSDDSDVAVVAPTQDNTVLAVTSFAGDKLDTNVGYHVVRGTTPANTHSIKVNDYTLIRYIPGQTQWNYIASSTAGTMVKGENKYTVTSFDAQNNQIGSKDFTILYNEPDNLPAVGVNTWMIFGISLLISALYFVIRRLRKVAIKNIL